VIVILTPTYTHTMRTLTTFLLIIGLFSLLQAQNPSKKPNFLRKKETSYVKHVGVEVGGVGGVMLYTGDLHSNRYFLKQMSASAGGFARYHLNESFSARANFLIGKIKGDDDRNYPDHPDSGRKFSFSNTLTEFGVALEWEPLSYQRYVVKNTFTRTLSPYFSIGMGLLYGKPTVDYNETYNISAAAQIAADKAATTSTHFTVPFGAGIRYDLTPQITVGVEGFFRFPFTDYLDGVSLSGNPKRHDWYYTGMANVAYRLEYHRDGDKDGIEDKKDACPDIVGILATNGCPDRDGDDVADELDICPDQKGVAALGGCPDRDKDGVADKEDNCPDQKGLPVYRGCPDTDGDGIIDSRDDCPNQKGSIAFNGCLDSDGDGISDKQDPCPNQKGSKADNGCPPKDLDMDGIPDRDDLCPDKAGLKIDNGCPAKDADEDGIADRDDNCPNISGIRENKGCPVVTPENNAATIVKEDKEVFEEALYGIEFETGSAVIKSSSFAILNKVFEVLNRRKNFNFEIAGHTDNVGSEKINQQLSDARAKAVYTYLTKKGIDNQRFTTRGYGSTLPVADNKSAAGRLKNRRVEFVLK
jgi:OmpA-OmpF porin, OOP family